MAIAIAPERDSDLGSQTASETSDTPTAARFGPLFDEKDEKKAFKRAEDLWKQNPRQHRYLAAVWKRNKKWRDGERFIKIIEEPDSDIIRLSTPPGMEGVPPVPNACDTKIRDLVARMLTDPPKPECQPWDDTPQARDAAHFANRALSIEAGEAGLNTDNVFAECMDIAGTYASAFAYVCYDPKGGGLQPREVSAHPDARTLDEAETGPPEALPKPAIRKYVLPGGKLADASEGAEKTWVSSLRIYKFTGNHVRFLPRTASGVEDAHGLIFAHYTTLGDLKSRFPRVRQMPDKELWELVNWKVPEWKRLLPEGMEYEPPVGSDNQKAPDNDRLVLTLTVVYKSHAEYPYGGYFVFGGGKYRLHKEPWVRKAPDARGELQDECLDLPFAQFRWNTDAQGQNPYGKAPAEKLGPMDEMRASHYAAMQEYLYRFSRARPMIPMGSIVQPEDLADPEKPIYFNPNGQPTWQPVPPFPREAMEMVDRIDVEMDREVSVFDPGRGLAAGSVRSAEQQQQIVEQGNAGTSFFRANMEDGYNRLHRIILQQMRAFYSKPRMLRYQGPGGSWQVEEWRNIDLGSTREVRIQKGTFTLLAPTAKANMIMQQQQAGTITPLEAYRLGRDNISPLIGVAENPHVERIKRQLWMWRKGPSESTRAQSEQYQAQLPQLQAQQQVAAQAGQQQELPPDPMMVEVGKIFRPLPVDEEPEVAVVRHQELSRAVSEMEQWGHPEPWNQGLAQVYQQARMAAGIQTVAEQQQAAQAQQQAQQQQMEAESQQRQQDSEQERQNRQADHDMEMQQKQESARADADIRQLKAMQDAQQRQMRQAVA